MPSDRKLRKKIEKYELRLDQLRRERHSRGRSRSRSRSRSRLRLDVSPFPDPPSDTQDMYEDNIQSVTILDEQSDPTADKVQQTPTMQCPDVEENAPQKDSQNAVAAFREALGVEYADCNKFEGNIQTEITKRWNHILVNGLTKEEKDGILKKYKLPENCQLLEAPILNDEVKSVMTENSKTRDRSLEMTQHQLGLATAIVGQVMTNLIDIKDVDKIHLVAKLTDASKLLNDINFQKTRTRRLLTSPLLDKNFKILVEKVKRDEHLYGIDLGAKIKTNQELKKSSSQIKKNLPKAGPNKTVAQAKTAGNRYGPPQTQANKSERRHLEVDPGTMSHSRRLIEQAPAAHAPRGLHNVEHTANARTPDTCRQYN